MLGLVSGAKVARGDWAIGGPHMPDVSENVFYKVQPGENLSKIVEKLYGKDKIEENVDKLYEENEDKIGPDRNHIKSGMFLKIDYAKALKNFESQFFEKVMNFKEISG